MIKICSIAINLYLIVLALTSNKLIFMLLIASLFLLANCRCSDDGGKNILGMFTNPEVVQDDDGSGEQIDEDDDDEGSSSVDIDPDSPVYSSSSCLTCGTNALCLPRNYGHIVKQHI
ncbi:MAG: hypothetical protein SVZ03_02585 [Spirochaetota bacterium]|nr:hypothetical protein [Spirochaetota bacterium]